MIKKVLFTISALCFGLMLMAQTSVVADTLLTPVDSVKNITKKADAVNKTQAQAPAQKTQEASESKGESKSYKSTLDGGLYLRAGLVFPSSKYMMGNAKNFGYDFQMGSQYYIGPVVANRLRFGLDVTWYDFAYTQLDAPSGHSLIASALGVGPLMSFAIADNFAVTTYGKAVPTFAFSVGEEAINYTEPNTGTLLYTENKVMGRGGFCIAGIWGIDMRYSLFNLGFEINWGNPNAKEVFSDVSSITSAVKSEPVISYDSFKINNTRVYIGLRF